MNTIALCTTVSHRSSV